MKRSLLVCVFATTIVPAFAQESFNFRSSFEGPEYSVGDLNGQGGWSTMGSTTLAFVQTYSKRGGNQAIGLGSFLGEAAVEKGLKGIGGTMLRSSVAIACDPNIVDKRTSDHSAYMRLVGTDERGNEVAINYGVTANMSPNPDAKKNPTCMVFANMTVNNRPVGALKTALDPRKATPGWHNYAIDYDAKRHVVTVYVDDVRAGSFRVTGELLNVDTIGLRALGEKRGNGRPTTFFDDTMLFVK